MRPSMAKGESEDLEAQVGQLLLDPGDIVDFKITPQLFNSTASVRP